MCETRRLHPNTWRSSAKNALDGPATWPIQPMSVENRTGQGRLGNGLRIAVASRDGLAARRPRAREGLI